MKKQGTHSTGFVDRSHLLAFLVIVMLIGVAGYGYFSHHKRIIIEAKQNELTAIADLKARQITQWRNERLGDAASVSSNAMLAVRLENYLNRSLPQTVPEEFRVWMESLRKNYGYRSADLYRTDCALLVSTNDDGGQSNPAHGDLVKEAARRQETLFSDFQQDNTKDGIHLNLATPIGYVDGDRFRVVAVLVLGVDPQKFLYPMIKTWPSASRSAETILVKQSGDEVLYLSDARHLAGASLAMRRPLSDRTLPAVRAVFGEEGVFEGKDYRGIPVLAATRTIPDSPWALVAKVDVSEIQEPIILRACWVILFSLVLALAAGLGIFLWWVKKWKLFKQQHLVEQNLQLEAKVEERTHELRQQLNFTQTLLDAIPNPVYFKDAEGRYLGCNKAYEDFRGISKENFCGKRVADIAMPEDAEALHAIDMQLLEGSAAQQYETSILQSNGARRDVVYHKACFYSITGEPAGLIGVVQDITALEKAKRTIKKQNEELEQRILERTRSLEDANEELVVINKELELRRREAESIQKKLQQLSSAVVNSPVTVVITDYQGQIEYVNPKFTDITGYLPEEAIGQNPKILNSGRQPKELYRELWETILDGREWYGDFCNRKKNGDIYWEHASISPIRDEQGTITHFVAIKEDVTEQRRIAEELVAARDAANAATRSKSEFLANMSHEIRTPLNAIIGFSELTLKTSLPPRQHDYLEKIHTSGELLLNIINDILDFSKIEAGRLVMEQIPFDLATILANVSGMLQQKAQDKGLRLLVGTPPEVASCLVGDPHRLSQVILNLLNNAVKFTEHGEVLLATELLMQQDERVQLKFSVRDSGIGISGEQLGRLFQPFTQADGSTTRRFGGTGLGLSISKQLVEMMEGTIWCESSPGNGSTFSFTVWLGIGQQDSLQPCRHPANAASGEERRSLDFSGSRILLTEDNEINRHLVIELLKETGAGIHVAANGSEAVRMIADGDPYDLVLMDIQMPVMDGYRATEIIRSDRRFATLPIIAMTAHAMQEDYEKIMQAGMDAHITKPIDAGVLLRTLSSFLPARIPGSPLCEVPDDGPIPDIEGFNVADALSRINGERDLYLWILRSFVENHSDAAEVIEEALSAQESRVAVRHAHTIKGIAGAMGAVKLEKLALELEHAIGTAESPAELRASVDCFAAELDRVVGSLLHCLPPDQHICREESKGT